MSLEQKETSSLIATLRKPRIAGITVFDTLGTVVIAAMIAKKMGWHPLQTILYAFIIGELVHVAGDIDTPITRALTSRDARTVEQVVGRT